MRALDQWLTLKLSIGTSLISFGLPILLYVFTFACNDVTGCPAPSLLHPKSIDLDTLKRDIGWPEDGIWGLASWKATAGTMGYYLFSAVLYRILPGTEVEGTELASGGRLKYKFNGEARPHTLRAVAALDPSSSLPPD